MRNNDPNLKVPRKKKTINRLHKFAIRFDSQITKILRTESNEWGLLHYDSVTFNFLTLRHWDVTKRALPPSDRITRSPIKIHLLDILSFIQNFFLNLSRFSKSNLRFCLENFLFTFLSKLFLTQILPRLPKFLSFFLKIIFFLLPLELRRELLFMILPKFP